MCLKKNWPIQLFSRFIRQKKIEIETNIRNLMFIRWFECELLTFNWDSLQYLNAHHFSMKYIQELVPLLSSRNLILISSVLQHSRIPLFSDFFFKINYYYYYINGGLSKIYRWNDRNGIFNVRRLHGWIIMEWSSAIISCWRRLLWFSYHDYSSMPWTHIWHTFKSSCFRCRSRLGSNFHTGKFEYCEFRGNISAWKLKTY